MGQFALFGYHFLWTFKGDQPDFEAIFPAKGVAPSSMVFYGQDRKIALLTLKDGIFKVEPIETFLLAAVHKRANTMYNFPGLIPIVVETQAWKATHLHPDEEIPKGKYHHQDTDL